MKSVASSLSSCSGCGQCQSACPVFRLTGVESDGPRGKISVIRAVADGDLTMEEAAAALSRCVLCGACSRACPAGVPATRAFEEARGRLKPGREKTGSIIFSFLAARPRLWNLVQNPLFQFRRAREYLPPFLARFSVPARERFAPRVPEIREGEKRVLLWGGCLASRQLPSILEACEAVITKAGFAVVAPDDLPCCGRPRLLAGKEKAARELARESLKLLAKQKFDFLVSPCAGCANAIKNTWPRLVAADEERKEPAENLASRAFHIDDFAAKFLGSPAIPDQVAVHKSCLSARGGREPDCCGACAPDKKLGRALGLACRDNLRATGKTAFATSCPACILALGEIMREKYDGAAPVHFVELLAAGLASSPETGIEKKSSGGSPED